MGVFRQFPYSNFHEMNMDEILKIIKTLQEEWNTTRTEWASYKDFIDNYFANLNVSEEVLSAIRTLAVTGELNRIIDPVIVTETTNWLNEHITPTSPIVDDTLSIEGAAADAKATGDRISYNKSDITALQNVTPFNLLNGVEWEVGSLDPGDGSPLTADNRIRTTSFIDVRNCKTITFTIAQGFRYVYDTYDANYTWRPEQQATNWRTGSETISFSANTAYIKLLISKVDNTQTPVTIASNLTVVYSTHSQQTPYYMGKLTAGSDFNSLSPFTMYGIISGVMYENKPPVDSGFVITYAFQLDIFTQIAFELNGSQIYFRRYLSRTWGDWIRVDCSDRAKFLKVYDRIPDGDDFDNYIINGIWGIQSNRTYVNNPLPDGESGFLQNLIFQPGIYVQTVNSLDNTVSYTRYYINGWSEWVNRDSSQGANNVYYAFGDSITYGQIGGLGGQSKYNYPAIIARKLGIIADNNAVAGQGLIKDWNYIHSEYLTSLDMTDAILITLGWAYNDGEYYPSTPFGSASSTDATSFIGKYYTIMKEFQQKCPKAKVILITGYGYPDGTVNPVTKPTLTEQFTHSYTFSSGNKTVKEMYDTLEEMCHLHGWSCINQAKGTTFNQFNANELIGDQIHPNNDGYYVYGNFIAGRVEAEFANVGKW